MTASLPAVRSYTTSRDMTLDPRVTRYEPNPDPLLFTELAGSPTYRAAIECELTDGRRVLLAIGLPMGLEERDVERFTGLAQRAAKRVNKSFRTLPAGAIGAQERRNASAILRVADQRPAGETLDAIRDLLRGAPRGCTIAQLQGACRGAIDCLAALNQMAATREIAFDLTRPTLGDCTVRLASVREPA